MRALVVFGDSSGHPLSRLLKPGFKHCFCCVLDRSNWLLVDGRAGIPDLKYLTDSDFDLAGFYRDNGYTVVKMHQRDKPLRTLMIHNNCVGLVKAALCIRSYCITPWGLYKALRKER